MVAKFPDLNNRSPEDMPAKKQKMVCMTSSVHDCTQEQDGSLYFSSIVWQWESPSLSRIFEIQKFCFHEHDVTSNFSSLFSGLLSSKVSQPSNEECQKSLQPKKCNLLVCLLLADQLNSETLLFHIQEKMVFSGTIFLMRNWIRTSNGPKHLRRLLAQETKTP